ncbi:phosphoribosylglycinamide formyltransferase [Ferruginibacter sp. HRS2-29]|uniref:phosphoribosylglycinamide formyltransferase n=1 Tax=Ferruginibacter sp. HRS2-29 TaxID=2487334 RepID=UPI0020CF37D6|nr:phosphoribosylglycinamide formyltransferase [Ferruginibacter sp. HRS2-29]
MFQKLQTKWKVSGGRLLLILVTFATGGSLCGIAGRKILEWTGLEKGVLWVILYIVLITLIWPACVLLVSIPLGQFGFFKKYIRKLFFRMSGQKNNMVLGEKQQNLAIFASGAGSNAQKIIEHLSGHTSIKVALVVCNKAGAGVIAIAEKAGIPVLIIEKEQFFRGNHYVDELRAYNTDWIVLAGFLWKVPVGLIAAFAGRIINIHPALLPKYGGKGMYGKHVHEAVRSANETETGITIHFVDEYYDHGKIILQEKCTVTPEDDADSIAQKVHALEHQYFPKAVEDVILNSIIK